MNPAGAIDYLKDIKPILAEKCYPCHGALKQESDLRFETRVLMLAGQAVLPGDAANSPLIIRVCGDESERMPPATEGAALRSHEIELLRSWIEAGAQAPDEPIPTAPRDHWAFQPIQRPENVDSIDSYLNRRHMSLAIRSQEVAERSIVLRRLYLDLIGLPPSLEQLDDQRPWDQIVEELLSSPQHAERWARHWMDIWRYSDSYGLGEQLRNSQKHMWHWRDWIIQSLQQDKGYDRMLIEMLAGDELEPENPEVVRATGFLARNYYLFNRTTWLDDTIEHTGKAFLGLTLNCAKCHDHKYDPLTHVDYYRFRAIFEPHQVRLDAVPGTGDFSKDGLPRVFDEDLDTKTFLHIRGDPLNPDLEHALEPGVPAILASFQPAIEPIVLPWFAYAPGARSYVVEDRRREANAAVESAIDGKELAEKNLAALLSAPSLDTNPESAAIVPSDVKDASPKIDDARAAVEKADANLRARQADLASLEAIIAATEAELGGDSSTHWAKDAALQQAEKTRVNAEVELVIYRGDENKTKSAQAKLKAAAEQISAIEAGKFAFEPILGAKKALESPVDKESDYPAVYPTTSSGRRLALAKWITARENPLTARVAVNHVWMRHFGQPLVDSVFDFGLRAPQPELSELLDYLAIELIESGWSLRHLHRLIVNSRTYQLASTSVGADPKAIETDPENRMYWRMSSHRMDSQVVRDSLLFLAGELDLTLGGPSIEVGGASQRRSLYFKHSRDDQDKFLAMFDDADHLQCYRRSESIVPQQALALANSQLSIDLAGKIAQRLNTEHASEQTEFVSLAFMTLLARPPNSAEKRECESFLDELLRLTPGVEQVAAVARARSRLVHVLLNHNDFISIR